MQTAPQPVRITAQSGRLTSGIFTAGPHKGQRAITLDSGIFTAGPADPSERTTADIVNDVFGSAMKGGAA